MNPTNRLLIAFAFVLTALSSLANEYSGVAVNGEWLTREQLYVFQVKLGTSIPTGNYLFDPTGCWLNLNDDSSGCVGEARDSADVVRTFGYTRFGQTSATSVASQ